MKLVIEDSDYSTVGIPAGDYDLNDLGAIRDVNVKGGQPGAHHNIDIVLRLDSGMKPEPGSIGEPHFKFGVSVEDVPQHGRQSVTFFGRPEVGALPGQAFGYKVTVDDSMLHSSKDPKFEVRGVIEPGVRQVADEIIAALIKYTVERVTSPVAKTRTGRTRSQRRAAHDAFFGLSTSKPKGKCVECGGSGVWKNPANGAESNCSQGCPKP